MHIPIKTDYYTSEKVHKNYDSEAYDEVISNEMEIETIVDPVYNDDSRAEEVVDTMEKCAHCGADEFEIQCGKCAEYFCR